MRPWWRGPSSYAAQPDRRYPVLYLLHGLIDSDENWFGLAQPHFVNVPGAVDRAVRTARAS